jgi:hypothetical protein
MKHMLEPKTHTTIPMNAIEEMPLCRVFNWAELQTCWVFRVICMYWPTNDVSLGAIIEIL